MRHSLRTQTTIGHRDQRSARLQATAIDDAPFDPSGDQAADLMLHSPGQLRTRAQIFDLHVDQASRRVSVTGELDLSTVPLLVAAVAELQTIPGVVVIDLESVTFLDASALGALVRIDAGQRESATELRLQTNERVRQLARLGGLESMVSMVAR
jgi:anti-anti-sigma factor